MNVSFRPSRMSAGWLLVCAVALSACADNHSVVAPLPSAPAASVRTTVEDPVVRERREAIEPVARGLALAFQSVPLRQRFTKALRDSRFTSEHKLSLNSLLADRSAPWLSAIAGNVGQAPDALLQRVQGAGRFEVYLPVPEQRNRYKGGADILVAALTHEGVDFPAFDRGGNQVMLSHLAPPAQTVLVITTEETDFSSPLPTGGALNMAGSTDAVGTWATETSTRGTLRSGIAVQPLIEEDPCDADPYAPGCPPPPPPPPPPSTDGLYLRRTQLNDAERLEEWGRGNPELALRISRPPLPDVNGNPVPGAEVGCTQQKFTSSDPRYWDQDTREWSAVGTRRGLILTGAQIDAITQLYINGFAAFPIEIWENDSGGDCDYDQGTQSERQRVITLAQSLSSLYNVGSSALTCFNTPSAPVLNIGNSAMKVTTLKICPLYKVALAAWGILKTASGAEDDYVGTVYPIGPAPWASPTPTPEQISWWYKINGYIGTPSWSNYVVMQRRGTEDVVTGYLEIKYLESWASY